MGSACTPRMSSVKARSGALSLSSRAATRRWNPSATAASGTPSSCSSSAETFTVCSRSLGT